MAPRFFRLRDHVTPGEPLRSWGGRLAVPTMRDGRIVIQTRTVRLRPSPTHQERLPGRILPGSRIVEATDPVLAAALERSPVLVECDPPTELESRTAGTLRHATGRKATKED